MSTQVRLNPYERGIVQALVDGFGYKAREARALVVQYVEVIRKLGGYDNCWEHAQRLHGARENGLSPEAWVKRIDELRRDQLKDKGFADERGKAYA